jgi:hypothetical protein
VKILWLSVHFLCHFALLEKWVCKDLYPAQWEMKIGACPIGIVLPKGLSHYKSAAKRDCSADAAPWALAFNEAWTAAWWPEKASVSWLA